MRKVSTATVTVAAAAMLVLSGCSGRGEAAESAAAGFDKGATIGVVLPTKTSENWVLAGDLFTNGLKDAGFKGDVQYAGASSSVADQQSQITSMVTKGAKVIIIGSVDAGQLGSQVRAAHDAGAVVISYDRLITNSADVDYHIGFDAARVGELQGQSLLDGLKERFPNKTSYNVELFSGSPDDSNSAVFFNGAMKVLKPKIEDGTIKVVSGQTDIKQTATQGWLPQNAQIRMDTLLAGTYGSAELDGVLSPNDAIARAILTSVKSTGKTLPVVTGQDSEVESVKSIMAGEQYSTINKDTRLLVKANIEAVEALASGQKPKTTSDVNNNTKQVPANLLTPLIVTKANATEAYANDPTLLPLTK
ncbi:substrate-binding domain-containing protein [Paenarthrobacter sp. NPDC090517]|uniref:substrate-binding domain-containing protein n=1 Tax=Paenarthrobacter sp. NPDC090517 TaxID=3364381 RepID=UPI00382AD4E2